MIDVTLFTIEVSGYACSNPNCKHLSEYHDNIIGQCYNLKQGKTVAMISLGGAREIYCSDCITEVYHLLKSKLDKNLWAFH